MERSALVERETDETEIVVELSLDSFNEPLVDTTIPFFDHMLEQLGKHSGFALRVEGTGDTEIDSHHLIEDAGLALGQALNEALGDRRGITRYASMNLVFDETMVRSAVDISGRPFFDTNLQPEGDIEGFPLEILPEFYRSFAERGRLTLHIDQLKSGNKHHLAEATFKGLARVLNRAVSVGGDEIPSTKGTLTD